jgi:UDP-2,3-diacylglucosamine pyrophosphatase LpxH
MSHLVGIPVYQEYEWDYAGKRHLAIHGHQFDSFAINNHRISRVGQWIFLQMQRLDSRSKRLARYLDRLNTRWLRLSAQVAQGALSYAKQGRAERIFCGHTHVPLHQQRDEVEYYNCGAWVDLCCTYITIGRKGVAIHEYMPETSDDRDPRKERIAPPSNAARVAVPARLFAPAFGQGPRR